MLQWFLGKKKTQKQDILSLCVPAQTQRIYNRTCKVTKGGKREKMYQNWIQIQLRMLKLPENGIGNVKGSSLRRKQDRDKQERGKKKKEKERKTS